jgi:hypothetical protein
MAALCGEARILFEPSNAVFRKIVTRDLLRFITGTTKPVHGESRDRARAGVAWLLRAQDATSDGGVSYGYFPCSNERGWQPSYPETTGYIMPTLLDFAKLENTEVLMKRAIVMASWEADIQMPSGAVQGGRLRAPEDQTPSAFNTGMVLHGWARMLAESAVPGIAEAGDKAARFLVDDISEAGYFRTNGEFVSADVVKIYNALCAWALHLFGDVTGQREYTDAAIRVIEAAIRQQADNGWIRDNCLVRAEAPLTHTIGYTLQALLEVGLLSGREDFVTAAVRGIDPVVRLVDERGMLRGRFYSDWKPALFSSCLTGSAQLAIVMYRLYEHLGFSTYRECADRLVDYLKAMQVIDSGDEGIDGALAGSFPILGSYMTRGYPNWATKYLVDALILQEQMATPTNHQS